MTEERNKHIACLVNLNNLHILNRDLYILNSILLFKTKNLEQTCARV